MQGKKFDSGKPDWSLLPLKTLKPVVQVLTFGARKYSRGNWKHVPDAKNRYYAAAMRHIEDYQDGTLLDEESGHPHLAHAICCLIFLLWFEDNANKLSNGQVAANKNSNRRGGDDQVLSSGQELHQPPYNSLEHRGVQRHSRIPRWLQSLLPKSSVDTSDKE